MTYGILKEDCEKRRRDNYSRRTIIAINVKIGLTGMRPILARRPTERKTALLRPFCNRLIYKRLEKKAGFRNTKSD